MVNRSSRPASFLCQKVQGLLIQYCHITSTHTHTHYRSIQCIALRYYHDTQIYLNRSNVPGGDIFIVLRGYFHDLIINDKRWRHWMTWEKVIVHCIMLFDDNTLNILWIGFRRSIPWCPQFLHSSRTIGFFMVVYPPPGLHQAASPYSFTTVSPLISSLSSRDPMVMLFRTHLSLDLASWKERPINAFMIGSKLHMRHQAWVTLISSRRLCRTPDGPDLARDIAITFDQTRLSHGTTGIFIMSHIVVSTNISFTVELVAEAPIAPEWGFKRALEWMSSPAFALMMDDWAIFPRSFLAQECMVNRSRHHRIEIVISPYGLPFHSGVCWWVLFWLYWWWIANS